MKFVNNFPFFAQSDTSFALNLHFFLQIVFPDTTQVSQKSQIFILF